LSSAVEPKANIATVLLRPCKVTDLRSLLEIYREGFREELAFFFRRFSRSFFEAVFRLLIEDTIVAEVSYNVVGFIIPVLGVAPVLRAGVAQVVLTLPMLLLSVRSSFFIYVVQKLRNTEWGGGQLGIGCIAVKAEYRGRGIGGLLMREVVTRYPTKDMVLEVRPWNRSALRLYASAGFRETGVWRDPLGEWVVMNRTALL